MRIGAGLPTGQERIRVLYEEYIHYHWLKQVWDSPVTASPQLEPCFAAAMHGVELAFLHLADFIQDKRMYIARRPRIEAVALDIRAQVQLLGELVDGELEEEGQALCTTLTQDFPFACCPPTRAGPSHSPGLSHVIQAVRNTQDCMTAAERNSLIKISLQISNAFQSAFQRWTVGLGIEHQINRLLELQGVDYRIPVRCHNLDYTALVRPQVVEATLTKEVYDNPEDYFFRSIHLGTECWMFVSNTCVKAAADFARQGRWHIAAARITLAARILEYLGDHIMTLTRMNLRDYLHLKVQLEGTSGAGSSQVRAVRPLIQELITPLAAAVRCCVKRHQPDAGMSWCDDGVVLVKGLCPSGSSDGSNVSGDAGCEDLQLLQALKQVYLQCDQYPGLYNYAKALEDVESALQGGFYFKHYCLAANVIGSEARGTMRRAVAALKATYEKQLFPVLDAVRSQLGGEFDQSLSHMKGQMMDDIIHKYSDALATANSQGVHPQIAMIPPDVAAAAQQQEQQQHPSGASSGYCPSSACGDKQGAGQTPAIQIRAGSASEGKETIVLGSSTDTKTFNNIVLSKDDDSSSHTVFMCPFMSASHDVSDPRQHDVPRSSVMHASEANSHDSGSGPCDAHSGTDACAPRPVHAMTNRDTVPRNETVSGDAQIPSHDDQDGCVRSVAVSRSRSLSLLHLTLTYEQEGSHQGKGADGGPGATPGNQAAHTQPLTQDEEAIRAWLYSGVHMSTHFTAWLSHLDKGSSQSSPPCTPFLSHAWGHIPPRVLEAGCRALAQCAAQGHVSWDTFFGTILPQACGHVLRLLGCANVPDSARPSVHWGANLHELTWRLISGVNTQGGTPIKILSSDMEFYSFTRQANKACDSKLGYTTSITPDIFATQRVQWDVVPALPSDTFAHRLIRKAAEVLPDVIYCSQITYLTQSALLPDIPAFVSHLSDAPLIGQATEEHHNTDVARKSRDHYVPTVIVDGCHGFCAVPTDMSQAFTLPAVASGRLHLAYVAGLLKHAGCGPDAAFLVLSKACNPRPRNTGWLADVSVLSPGAAGIGPGSDVTYTPGLELQGSTPSCILPVMVFCELMAMWDNGHQTEPGVLGSTTPAPHTVTSSTPQGDGVSEEVHGSSKQHSPRSPSTTVKMIHKHVMYLQEAFLSGLKTLTEKMQAGPGVAGGAAGSVAATGQGAGLVMTYQQLVNGDCMVSGHQHGQLVNEGSAVDRIRSHALVFRFDTPQQAAEAVSKLASRGIAVDCRKDYLRIGFGFNHTLEDVGMLLKACVTP